MNYSQLEDSVVECAADSSILSPSSCRSILSPSSCSSSSAKEDDSEKKSFQGSRKSTPTHSAIAKRSEASINSGRSKFSVPMLRCVYAERAGSVGGDSSIATSTLFDDQDGSNSFQNHNKEGSTNSSSSSSPTPRNLKVTLRNPQGEGPFPFKVAEAKSFIVDTDLLHSSILADSSIRLIGGGLELCRRNVLNVIYKLLGYWNISGAVLFGEELNNRKLQMQDDEVEQGKYKSWLSQQQSLLHIAISGDLSTELGLTGLELVYHFRQYMENVSLLESDLAALATDITRFQEDSKAIGQQSSGKQLAHKEEIRNLRDRIYDLEEELDSYLTQNNPVSSVNQNMVSRKSMEMSDAENGRESREVRELKIRNADLERSLMDSQEETEHLLTEINKNRELIDRLANQGKTTEAQLSSAWLTTERLKADHSDAMQQVSRLENAREESLREKELLLVELRNLKERIECHQSSVVKFEERANINKNRNLRKINIIPVSIRSTLRGGCTLQRICVVELPPSAENKLKKFRWRNQVVFNVPPTHEFVTDRQTPRPQSRKCGSGLMSIVSRSKKSLICRVVMLNSIPSNPLRRATRPHVFRWATTCPP